MVDSNEVMSDSAVPTRVVRLLRLVACPAVVVFNDVMDDSAVPIRVVRLLMLVAWEAFVDSNALMRL